MNKRQEELEANGMKDYIIPKGTKIWFFKDPNDKYQHYFHDIIHARIIKRRWAGRASVGYDVYSVAYVDILGNTCYKKLLLCEMYFASTNVNCCYDAIGKHVYASYREMY